MQNSLDQGIVTVKSVYFLICINIGPNTNFLPQYPIFLMDLAIGWVALKSCSVFSLVCTEYWPKYAFFFPVKVRENRGNLSSRHVCQVGRSFFMQVFQKAWLAFHSLGVSVKRQGTWQKFCRIFRWRIRLRTQGAGNSSLQLVFLRLREWSKEYGGYCIERGLKRKSVGTVPNSLQLLT